MFSESQFIIFVNNCLLPKLVKNFDECDVENTYLKYQNELEKKVERVLCMVEDKDFSNLSSNALSSVFILYIELLSPGQWSNENSKILARRLNEHFETYTDVSLSHLLSLKRKNVDKQEVFDTCMMKLHLKLTSDDFKKYPGQVAVYCKVIENLQEYQVNKDPLNLIPISLILIDDFDSDYKINGLKSLYIVLKKMKIQDFKNGNYYEVIYGTLKKSLPEKDKEVTELVLQCFLRLLLIVPPQVKMYQCDNILSSVLDEHSMESNLYRKATLVRYTKELLKIIGVDCVKWKKKTLNMFYDNLDICLKKDVAEILLADTIKCLEEWIRHSWCVWKFETDKKLLITVTKSLIFCEQKQKATLERIMETLVKLSNPDEQKIIITEFRNMLNFIKCQGIPDAQQDDQQLDCLSKLVM